MAVPEHYGAARQGPARKGRSAKGANVRVGFLSSPSAREFGVEREAGGTARLARLAGRRLGRLPLSA